MSNHICPKCETAVIAAWRQELDGNYYHDRCLPFRGLLNHAESELTAANARIAELEQSIKRQAAAALAGMNATKAVSSWEIQEARRLKAECSPASIASQREANEVLTNELQAATVRIAALESLLGEAIESIEDWAGYASEYFREKYGLAEELAKFRAALGDP